MQEAREGTCNNLPPASGVPQTWLDSTLAAGMSCPAMGMRATQLCLELMVSPGASDLVADAEKLQQSGSKFAFGALALVTEVLW